jgi:aspartyl protease family protein
MRQTARVAAAVVLVTSSTLSLAAAVYVLTRERAYDYGQFGPAVARLSAQLAAAPCDGSRVIDLAETLARAGDQRGIVRSGDAFFTQCGDLPRLRWATYAAHARLGEDTAAIADATQLIESAPDDKDYRWWRGVIYERDGRLDDAVRDYRDALRIEPRLRLVPLNLADVYERQGRLDDAIDVLSRYVQVYPGAATQLRERFQRLQHRCTE